MTRCQAASNTSLGRTGTRVQRNEQRALVGSTSVPAQRRGKLWQHDLGDRPPAPRRVGWLNDRKETDTASSAVLDKRQDGRLRTGR